MKKFVVASLTLAVLGFGGGQASAETAPAQPQISITNLAISTIDNIQVPFEVEIYAQTHYQGYAITKVQKISRERMELYLLRIDRDDIPNDFESFYLVYNMKWELLGDEKMFAPPPPKVEEPKPPEQPKPEERKPEDRGRGGGEPVKPPEEPPEEVPDEGDGRGDGGDGDGSGGGDSGPSDGQPE